MSIREMFISGKARYVPGADDYAVTETGDVYSRNNHQKEWRKLKPANGNGQGRYLQVSFYGHPTLIHKLVAAAFLGPRPHGYDIRHRDGNDKNNTRLNLVYGTRRENMADAILHGWSSRGARNPQSKLKPDDVLKIRSMRRNGAKQKEIAEVFEVSVEAISQIVRRKRWAWLADN